MGKGSLLGLPDQGTGAMREGCIFNHLSKASPPTNLLVEVRILTHKLGGDTYSDPIPALTRLPACGSKNWQPLSPVWII